MQNSSERTPMVNLRLVIEIRRLNCPMGLKLRSHQVAAAGVEYVGLLADEGNGSGVVWHEEGHIVMNYHGEELLYLCFILVKNN